MNGTQSSPPSYRVEASNPMKAFVILVLLFLVIFFIASTSLANVDLTPDTPPAAVNNSFSAAAEEPQVINIQNPTVVPQVYTPSNETFPVTGAATCTDPYTIRPGDMLSGIAELCNTTVATIRLANPQITNINMIYPGQQIRIPGAPNGQQAVVPQQAAPTAAVQPQINAPEVVAQAPTVPVTTPAATSTAPVPVTGPYPIIQSGTMLQVKARYYPPNTAVNIAIGPQAVGYNIVATGTTDASGNLTARVVAPVAPDSQTPWVVVVATTGTPPVQAMSSPFYLSH